MVILNNQTTTQVTGNNMIDNIDLSKSKEYNLSIRISSDGFSFSVVNPQNKSEFMFSRYDLLPSTSVSANLKKWLSTTEELNLEYKKIFVIFNSSRFMAIPLSLYREDSEDELFYYNYSKLNNEKILSDRLSSDDIVMLYGVDKYCHQIITEHFNNCELICSSTSLLHYYIVKSRIGENKKIFIQLSEQDIKLFCFDNSKLLLLNSYKCKQVSDRLYYILCVWNKLNFDVHKDEIILNGNIKDKDMLQKELKRFVPNVYWLKPRAEFNRAPLAQVESFSFDMQTLLLCE